MKIEDEDENEKESLRGAQWFGEMALPKLIIAAKEHNAAKPQPQVGVQALACLSPTR
jgi:hypothetical protein